jgi:hypothetical protein
MANVLTNLAGDIYVAADQVGREVTGFIPSVKMNSGAERAALNGTVRAAFTQAAAAVDNTPSMTIPEGTDQTVDNKTMTLSKSKGVMIPYVGEDQVHLDNGVGYSTVYGDQIAQAMRTLTNLIEVDLAVAATAGASHGYGTAAATPFGTANDYTDASHALRLLIDSGAGVNDHSLVMNTLAGANVRGKQAGANQAGTDSILRQGVLLDVNGLALRESAQIQSHTKGTGASATTNTAGYAIGATTITLASAGTGTIVANDLITFTGDTTQYQVVTGDTDVSNGGTVVLQEPGLKVALPASAVAITVVGSSVRNIAFNRNAIELAVRAPAKPGGRDAALESMIVTDPRSGLSFDVSLYLGFQKMMINVSAVWGVKVWKPEFVKTLIG